MLIRFQCTLSKLQAITFFKTFLIIGKPNKKKEPIYKKTNLEFFSFSRTRNIIFGKLKIGQNDPEIQNLEFESHGFLENKVFLPTEQAGTNIFWMIHQDINFKICVSLFGWKENILHKQHIVHWKPLVFRITLELAGWQLADHNLSDQRGERGAYGEAKLRIEF